MSCNNKKPQLPDSDTKCDPQLLQTAILSAIFDELKTQSPEGVTEPSTIRVTSIVRKVRPPKPWFSIQIVNDGDAPVYVLVSPRKSFEWHIVNKSETYKVDMMRPLIDEVLFKCDAPLTASVRLVGVR